MVVQVCLQGPLQIRVCERPVARLEPALSPLHEAVRGCARGVVRVSFVQPPAEGAVDLVQGLLGVLAVHPVLWCTPRRRSGSSRLLPRCGSSRYLRCGSSRHLGCGSSRHPSRGSSRRLRRRRRGSSRRLLRRGSSRRLCFRGLGDRVFGPAPQAAAPPREGPHLAAGSSLVALAHSAAAHWRRCFATMRVDYEPGGPFRSIHKGCGGIIVSLRSHAQMHAILNNKSMLSYNTLYYIYIYIYIT